MEKATLFSYSWHIDENETNRTVIRVYGLNENNENVCIIINNFTPYVYIELPTTVTWDTTNAQLVVSKIDEILKERKPLIKQLMFKKRLYNANIENNNKKLYPYIFCCFNHVEDIKQLSYRLRRPINIPRVGMVNIKIHEHNASPILQLTSLRKIPTSGWINFIGKKISKDDQITHCAHEYSVSWKNLEEKKSDVVARPLCMSFDLEVNSSIPSSMPKAVRPNDKIFQISCIFNRQGSKPETYEKYLLTLGQCDLEKVGKDVKVITFETEHDLLLGFTNITQDKQPNVIIGYNIFGFDIPYMIDRAKYLYCIYDFDRLGMDKGAHAKERSISWSSSAYKNQSFQFLDAEGRLFVDLLPLVKRDYKMNNYKLDTIASHFLKGIKKDPLGPKGIFECYRIGMQGGKKGKSAIALCGKYCVNDSFIVTRLFEVLTTWVALCEMSKVTNVPIFSLYTQGQQLKVFSQVYRKCTHENTVVEKDGYISKEDDHYVGATVFPPIPGVYDKVIPFDFSSLYPTTIIAYNLCWSTLVTDDSVPDRLCNVMEWEDHQGCIHDPKVVRKTQLNEIIKSRDLDIKKIRDERDLKKNKNNKEYFNEIIEKLKKQTKPLRDERSNINKSKPKHTICCVRKFKWLKSPMGVLPEILSNLLDTRASTKKEMKGVKARLKEMKEDDVEFSDLSTYYDVLDQRQLALKVSANSGYGITGTQKGYLPCMPVAMCTTYMGRKAIEKAADEIQKNHGGKLIYGDTDSNYVSFPHLTTAAECWDHAIKVAVEVSKLFPKPMSMAYEEKIYWKFMILTKKRYMSLACERDGKVDSKISKKGVLLQRRDTCDFVRKIYGDVVMMIFNRQELDDILYYIIQELNKLCSAYYPVTDFIVTKSVGNMGYYEDADNEDGQPEPVQSKNDKGKDCWKLGDYTVKLIPEDPKKRESQFKLKKCDNIIDYYLHCFPAQAQLAYKMRKRGQLVAAGSRIEYVITTTNGHLAKQYVKVESSDYFIKHRGSLDIDYLYYLKQLTNPLDQILNVIYDKPVYKFSANFMLEQYKYRYQIRDKMINELKSLYTSKLVFQQ
jgi:DNA polymerase elongation subunit (family B)